MREASVDFLVIFVGSRNSFGNLFILILGWDCRMEHVVLEAKKMVHFDTNLNTTWPIWEGVQNPKFMNWWTGVLAHGGFAARARNAQRQVEF